MMKTDLTIIEEMKLKVGNNLEMGILNHNNRRILLYTHFDLDGLGTIILLNQFSNIELEYKIFPRDANECINDIEKWNEYTDIIFTDLSVSDEVASIISNFKFTNPNINIILLDHHESSIYLNRHEWCFVRPHDLDNDIVMSGTWLLYLYLQQAFEISLHFSNSYIHEFARRVAYYDTFYFKREASKALYENDEPEDLCLLWNSIDKNEFIEQITDNIKHSIILNKENLITIKTIKKIIEKECWKQYYNTRICTIDGKVVAFFYCESYISQVAAFIYEKFPVVDYVCTVNMNKNTVSLRTRKDMNLSKEIAIPNGGGGHPQACGFTIDGMGKKVLEELIVPTLKTKSNIMDQIGDILKVAEFVDDEKNVLLEKYLDK